MASVAAVEERSVSVGRVFSRAFGTIGSNPVATLGIAFLFGAVPTLLLDYAVRTWSSQAVVLLGEIVPLAIILAMVAIGIALAMITQGALVRATVAHDEGRQATFTETASAGLAVALPLVLMALLSSLAIFAGLVLLVVPGVILFVIWSVAAPALVEERLGVTTALGRSRELTQGARWKVFALLLVVTVLSWLFAAAFELLNMTAFGVNGDIGSAIGDDVRPPLAFYALNAVFQTLNLAAWGVVQTSLYVELRNWKDGPATEKLADIFG